MPRVTILINQRPFHFDDPHLTPDDFRRAVGSPAEYEVWRIIRDPDPEGQLPVDDQQITEAVSVHNGERYRVVPPGTFGLASFPAQLAAEIEELRSDGFVIEALAADGWLNIVIRDYPIPRGFSKRLSSLLLRFPLSYPNGKPDMFWTDTDVVLSDGKIPDKAEQIETALGRQWRRFSWHPAAWNPVTDNLRTYLEFVNRRLALGK